MVAMLLLMFAAGPVPVPAGWWDAKVEASLARSPETKAKWEAMLEATPPERRAGLAYLVTDLPRRDLDSLDPAALALNAELAYKARAETSWGPGLPENAFLDAVLPHASLTEPRDPLRAEFLARYMPLVKDSKTPGEAALKINAALFVDYKVRYNTRRLRTDQCSKESIAQGMATCTGLSIMLVEACRAVGVPARVAGIHSWPGRGGNHTWVEVWDGGNWHYVGAAEPDPKGLDHAWFTDDAAKAVKSEPRNSVFAATYKSTGTTFPLAWNPRAAVNGENVTDRYTAKSPAVTGPRLMVEVRQGGERVVADVSTFDRLTGRAGLAGKSLGPAADVNLHLSGPATPGEAFLIIARRGDANVARCVNVGAADSVVRIDLDRPPADDAQTRQVLGKLLADRFGTDDAKRKVAAALLAEVPFDDTARAAAWEAYKTSPVHDALRKEFDAKTVSTADRTSPYLWRNVGETPPGGRALVIAMHGGGNAPKAVNDRQWEGMFTRYYKEHPEAGGYVYLALRAPNDTWNGFYDDAICPMVERLILQFVLFEGVNPDRVYTLGASHGGYGAFVIGTKDPDRFAAVHASASAPTDGETRGENLLNTPFTFMVGEKDTAFGRAERCLAFEKQVQTWRAERGGYPGAFEWRPGVGHSVPDRDKLAEMLKSPPRNAWPKRVYWAQTDDVLKHSFWVESPEPADGATVDASVSGNTVTIKATNQNRLALWLDPALLDLAKPVTITADGKTTTVVPKPSLETYCLGLEQRHDPKLAAPVRVEVSLKD